MKRVICGASILAVCIGVLGFARTASSQTAAQQDDNPAAHQNLYLNDVIDIGERDKNQPPPINGIMFIGGGVFTNWHALGANFNSLPVYNHAFGGARTWEINHYEERLVRPYHPSVIVYAAGSNDVNTGELPGAIVDKFKQFCSTVKDQMADTKIIYVSIIRAPQLMSNWSVVDVVNHDIKDICQSDRNLIYVDINPIFVKRLGQPRMELFKDDEITLAPLAYDEMAKVIEPVVTKAYKSVKRHIASTADSSQSGNQKRK